MKKMLLLILMVLASVCTANVAQAQIGWTLAQCRKHFGHEMKESPFNTNDTATRTFGINYRHNKYDPSDPDNLGGRGFTGRLVDISFDTDDTAGRINWQKYGSEFSDQEINQLLKSASAVSWRTVQGSPKEWGSEAENGPIQWVGEHNGVILFDAEEGTNFIGCFYLTITTRQLY